MQMSLRLPDRLAAQVRDRAARSGKSVNGWITLVLSAAVDPELAGSEVERIRDRLRLAGLLDEAEGGARKPDPGAVARARRAAGRGTPLAAIVTDDRG